MLRIRVRNSRKVKNKNFLKISKLKTKAEIYKISQKKSQNFHIFSKSKIFEFSYFSVSGIRPNFVKLKLIELRVLQRTGRVFFSIEIEALSG